MKKLLLVFVLFSVTLSSCQKEEFCKNKNCGEIIADNIVYDENFNPCYSLAIKNNCSGNVKTFCFDYSAWLNANVGEEFCVEGTPSW